VGFTAISVFEVSAVLLAVILLEDDAVGAAGAAAAGGALAVGGEADEALEEFASTFSTRALAAAEVKASSGFS
jgi:hypothetical protein